MYFKSDNKRTLKKDKTKIKLHITDKAHTFIFFISILREEVPKLTDMENQN